MLERGLEPEVTKKAIIHIPNNNESAQLQRVEVAQVEREGCEERRPVCQLFLLIFAHQ